MQHLEATHGPITEVAVRRVFDEDVYSQAIGWHYLENDYSFRKFFEFPELHGWKVGPDYRLDYDSPSLKVPGSDLADRLAGLLQTWLFFGLVYTLVRDAEGPLLRFGVLSNHDTKEISTEGLEDALQKARQHILQVKRGDHDEAGLYMVQIEDVLQHAKMVVRKNCGHKPTGVRYRVSSAEKRTMSLTISPCHS